LQLFIAAIAAATPQKESSLGGFIHLAKGFILWQIRQ